MSLYSIRTIQVWVAMHILASISTVFAGLSVEYKWLSSNCTFLDVHVATFAPSIGMCAVLCTQTSDCNGFIWKENGCDMLKTCPRCCKSNSDIDTEWSLYCPDGKIKRISFSPAMGFWGYTGIISLFVCAYANVWLDKMLNSHNWLPSPPFIMKLYTQTLMILGCVLSIFGQNVKGQYYSGFITENGKVR